MADGADARRGARQLRRLSAGAHEGSSNSRGLPRGEHRSANWYRGASSAAARACFMQRDLCGDEEANSGVADFEQLTTEGTEDFSLIIINLYGASSHRARELVLTSSCPGSVPHIHSFRI